MSNNLARPLVAEFIGTFALIFAGVLSISGSGVVGASGIANLASIGLAHGLAIAVMVAALGAVSGGHFNPAVTFGFLVTGRITVGKALMYWVAQLLGGAAAGFLMVFMYGATPVAGATPDLGTNVSMSAGIITEIVTTFFLVLVVFGTAVDPRAPKSVYPFAIGLTVALDIMATGPLTGAAMNPARWFGPAIASGHFANAAVYWIGPLIGGALAAAVQHFFLMEKTPAETSA